MLEVIGGVVVGSLLMLAFLIGDPRTGEDEWREYKNWHRK